MHFLSFIIGLSFLSSLSLASANIVKKFPLGDFKPGHFTYFMDDGNIKHVPEADNANFLSSRVVLNPSRSISKSFGQPKNFKSMSAPKKEVTRVDNYYSLQDIMDTMRRDTREESQCYNRAHMWTFMSHQRHSINLGKVWIFFTKEYIREYNYKWWFHIAPYGEVLDGTIYVLDKGFTTVPFNLTNWKNIFVKSQENCIVAEQYTSEVAGGQGENHCYLLFSNQFFYEPSELASLGNPVAERNSYFDNQVIDAFRDALINWNGVVPGLKVQGDDFLFQLGEQAITQDGDLGTITKLRGEMVELDFHNGAGPILKHKMEVGKLVDPKGQLVASRPIRDTYGRFFVIHGFFMNNQVIVKQQGFDDLRFVFRNMFGH